MKYASSEFRPSSWGQNTISCFRNRHLHFFSSYMLNAAFGILLDRVQNTSDIICHRLYRWKQSCSAKFCKIGLTDTRRTGTSLVRSCNYARCRFVAVAGRERGVKGDGETVRSATYSSLPWSAGDGWPLKLPSVARARISRETCFSCLTAGGYVGTTVLLLVLSNLSNVEFNDSWSLKGSSFYSDHSENFCATIAHLFDQRAQQHRRSTARHRQRSSFLHQPGYEYYWPIAVSYYRQLTYKEVVTPLQDWTVMSSAPSTGKPKTIIN